LIEPENAALIWAGRLHLGDDPGVFGDAAYAGLGVELPVTVYPFDQGNAERGDICFLLEANHVRCYGGLLGHQVTVYAFEPNPREEGWLRIRVAGPFAFESSTVRAPLTNTPDLRYLSVRVDADACVQPGLYNDLVLISLMFESRTHYAEFGFRTIKTRLG
jgi:hypothetical protein